MKKHTRRIVAIAVLIVLVVASLITGTLSREEESNKKEEEILTNYLGDYLNGETVKTVIEKQGNGDEIIQKINVEGTITEAMINKNSKSSVINQIKDAKNNPNVKAILLSINSPGGGVYETAEIYEALKNSGKDIYVQMRQYAASGGYYIATTAKKIYAHNDTTTGSIGVIMSSISAQKFLNDNGIKQETIRSGEQKAVGGIAEDMNEKTKEIYKEINKETFDRFVNVIVEGRHLSEEEVRNLADGRVYSGSQAVKNKLIDKIGSEEQLIEEIAKEKGLTNPQVKVLVKTESDTFLKRFVRATLQETVSELKSEANNSQVKQSYLLG